jgi:predicted nucleotidyltransferase
MLRSRGASLPGARIRGMTSRERLHELVDELSEPEMDDALRALIQEAARRILGAAPPGTRLILFGSAARGEMNEHSDLDFLVIEPTVADPIRESVRLDRTLRGMLVPTDIIVRSQESVRKWRDVYGTVINAALEEGLELAA